ncbi:MAG: TetR/AcrR family transcriptional regulator [Chlorobi bacterium]|nr:TetR/AcrR family transcriptional regulator [Chlorobiota bacterium]
MTKNEIQEQRMRGYFLESAKNIIRSEGVKSISVRNVAESAGYSYATLYNYFSDIKELMYHCIDDFNDECRVFVNSQRHPDSAGLDSLLSKVKAYLNFYVQYTGIYELIFVADIPYIKDGGTTNLFEEIVREDFNQICKDLSDDDKDVKMDLLISSIRGQLQLYLIRRTPADYSEFIRRSMNTTKLVFK